MEMMQEVEMELELELEKEKEKESIARPRRNLNDESEIDFRYLTQLLHHGAQAHHFLTSIEPLEPLTTQFFGVSVTFLIS